MENILFFDTETTGIIPRGITDPLRQVNYYPHVVQLSWQIGTKEGDFIIRPDGFTIPPEAAKVHGITTDRALAEGVPYKQAFLEFFKDVKTADTLCAHNANFDKSVIIAEYVRMTNVDRAQKFQRFLLDKPLVDTMLLTCEFVGARFPNGEIGKYPRLEELYDKLFHEKFPAHNSLEDVRALARCYWECEKIGIF